MTFRPFAMERWQSTWENRVAFNLSESGVEPLTMRELLALGGEAEILDSPLGYGQSNGSDALRHRIAALYEGGSEAGVVAMNGSAEANFVAMWELVSAGDEVVILTPTYMQTVGLAENFGARVREVPLREEYGWQPDPDEIRRAIGPRTRVIVVTNPSNPTGARLAEEPRASLLAAAAETGAWILADEVYTGAERDGVPTPSFFGAHERVIATGSLSKAYGLPGLRIGWAMSDPDTAEKLWARTDYTTISPGELTDRLAAIALREDVRNRLVERTRGIINDRFAVLEEWLGAQGVFVWQAPEAGAICFARYEMPLDSDTMAERLRVEQDVLIVPGSQFGVDRYIRFGFGLPEPQLRAALARVASLLESERAEVR